MSVEGLSVLVTGATGFLGGQLAATLVEHGARVRVLARRSSDLGHLAALGVEILEGDLGDPASVARAAADRHVIFHTAGKVADWGPRQEFLRDNVEGTRHVIAACRAAGVERLIHVSSLTVLGLPRRGQLVDEQTPTVDAPRDRYSESKLGGERLVREAHGQHGLSTTVIRSGVIWGAGDPTILPRIVALLRRGRMVYIDGGSNPLGLSHVVNLAHALTLAAGAPAAAGQIYHVTDDEEITARQALDAIAEVLGAPRPRLSLPYGVVYAVAAACEAAAAALGRTTPPALTRYGVRLVACDCRYDIGKAKRELGYRPLVRFLDGIAGLVNAPPGDENP